MKLVTLTTILLAASTSALAPPLPIKRNTTLRADLPDEHFSIVQAFQPSLLPVVPTLLNVLHFMGMLSEQGFDTPLGPDIYSAPGYQDIQIQTYALTEVRFLLWGIYTAIGNMLQTARLHTSMIKLYWKKMLMGSISLAVKPPTDLLTMSNDSTLTGSDMDNTTASKNTTRDDETEIEANSDWANSRIAPDSSVKTSLNTSLSVGEAIIELSRLAGGRKLDRNEVFLTFYTAILHVAQHQLSEEMDDFESQIPMGSVWLDMYEGAAHCQVRLCHLVRLTAQKCQDH